MTLEDFVTLSAMKDGLTAPYQVQELVSVMQKEKDCGARNAGETTRQWAAVASTIAATENRACLDLFIQLGGLWFINRWLKDTQNFAIDANDRFIEESITGMLRAVEQLHLDSEKSVSSGIHATVSNLLGHDSSRVENKARLLVDSWKGSGNGDAESHDIAEVNNASSKLVREEGQPSSVTEAGNNSDNTSGLVGNEKSLFRSPDSSIPERIASVQIQSSSNASLECEEIKQRSPNYLASVSFSAQEVVSVHEQLPLRAPCENALVGSCTLLVPKQDNVEGQPDVVQLTDFAKTEFQEQNVNGPAEKIDTPEICLVSTKLEPGPISAGASEAKALEPVKEPTLELNGENNEFGVCHKIVTSGGVRSPASGRKNRADHIIPVSKASENDDDCHSNVLWDSSISESELGKTEVLDMSISGTEYARALKESKGHVSSEGENNSNGSDFNKPGKGSRSPSIIDKKSSADEFDNGIIDAIEVTRQIALEIEREVCSSSEKITGGAFTQPSSPGSVKKEDTPSLVPPKEVPSRESHSSGACSDEEQCLSISNNIIVEPERKPNKESLQVSEAAQDSGGNSEKRLCLFDLNEEGSDDMDVSVNAVSTPIPIVSASIPAPNPRLPGDRLQFEGKLGWKGSTATSAFGLASPCNSERNLSSHENSDISKQRLNGLDFDLNVSEAGEGSAKPIVESSFLSSGTLLGESSPKRSSRLELDLNSLGDDCDSQPSDQRTEGQFFLGRNGCWSPSPASSTSTMHPSVRNINLNDRPCLQTDLVDHGPGNSPHFIDAFGLCKSDVPAISIFGTKVDIGRRREYVPQTLFLPNGKAIEPAIDLTISRAGGILGMPPTASYNLSSVIGYNGVACASAPPLSFSSAMYGSVGTIPYMVDSRGAPLVPQVAAASSSTVLPSYSQPSFIMNMTATELALNGVGPSYSPNLDLNGLMIEGGGNRDALTTRQFFFPGQGTMSRPSSSGVGGKRKEPESGWESYPFNHKYSQPPWK